MKYQNWAFHFLIISFVLIVEIRKTDGKNLNRVEWVCDVASEVFYLSALIRLAEGKI
jgi:hypothetical protein